MRLRGGASPLRRARALGALAVAGAAALAAVALGGCGASSVVDPVARAATISNQAPGYRALLNMRMSAPTLPAPLKATGNGTVDVRDHAGTLNLVMDLSSIPQAAQVLGTSTLRLQEIITGLTLYLKFPPAITSRSAAFHGKPWVKINLAQAARGLGIQNLGSLMNNPTSSDPSQFLRYLRGTSGGVTKVGTATVDGFQTTHYRATIQLDRVANGVPPAERAQARQSIAALERVAHIHAMPVQVWIDRSNLVRRMRMAFQETISGQSVDIGIQLDIPHYGPEPIPPPPPASQVTDITSLSSGSAAASASSTSG